MTAQLAGRELDEAASFAMGWVFGMHPGKKSRNVWWRDGVKRQARRRYSNDPMLLPEMLAWLGARGSFVTLQYFQHGPCYATLTAKPCGTEAEGDTIFAATANLVVAVAAAREARP